MVFFWRKQCKIIPIVFPNPENKIKEKNCPICLKVFENNKVFLPCGHPFHADCILDWIDKKPNCPICRFPLCWSLINKPK